MDTLTPVKSSNIAAIGLSEGDLLIKYVTGVIYRYFGAADHYERMMTVIRSGGSVGSYVATFIKKPKLPYAKLEELPS